MKKIIAIIGVLMLWASSAFAQQAPAGRTSDSEDFFDGRIGAGWYGITHQGNVLGAGEYNYLKSSASGALDMEWDPLPHRFVLETYYLNPKDYFGEADYSFKDVVVMNAYTRDLFHNLNHYSLGPNDPTGSPKIDDLNPNDRYGIDNHLSRAFLRLKTPDFPLHLYADVKTVERQGTIQQRFYQTFDDTKVSQSRRIDWNTTEFIVGLNSHLGPIEADYSHTEKKFEARGDKVLFESSSGVPIPHNLVPDLRSSWDTVKVHTTYSGRFVLAGTYTTGEKKNEDSGAKVAFTNGAGDLLLMPVTSLIVTVKYRHYDLDATTPQTISVTGLGTFNVRESISSNRNVLTALVRYRATDRLTLRGEYLTDNTDRTPAGAGSVWDVPESTTKNTGKAGFGYRILNKMYLRGDYSVTKVDNPAYDTDPDRAQNGRLALTWSPTLRFNTMLSYQIAREKRDNLSAPLGGGSREAARDQGLASATYLLGARTSLTASYAYYKNRVDQTLTLQDATGVFALEPGVPYEDIAQVGSLTVTVAPSEGVNLTAGASRSYAHGNYRLNGAGSATNVSGIAELTDMKIVDTTYDGSIQMEFNRYLSSEIRLQYRRYDDQIDDTQDGTVKMVLATLYYKW